MEWILDKDRPICPQICEQVCLRVALGVFKPGERLLSVREVALQAKVNPNTVQKAFDVLEQKGILFSQRGSGWYVEEDVLRAKSELENIRKEKTDDYFNAMKILGMNTLEIKSYVESYND